MYNDLLTIGPVTIHGYGLMTAMGILAAYFSAEYRAKKKGLDSSKVFGLVVCCVALGYVCSKALYLITVLPDILADPSIFWSSLANGWVVLGGILGGILGGWLYCRWRKLPTWNFFDVGMASVALAQGFGRIGCFLAGCCYGAVSHGPLAVTFTDSDFAPNHVPLVPTQLISSALDFLLCFFLYSAGRFVLEFWRGDINRGFVGPLSTSQFMSIFTFLAGVILLVLRRKSKPVQENSSGTEAEEKTSRAEAAG